ncbi:MAG: T9SS type A sorting domain-containing protein [Bacteroidetes bacterium]|nr:T9SS type A sorting domain-containing protein [Bacteroidota bacterium]
MPKNSIEDLESQDQISSLFYNENQAYVKLNNKNGETIQFEIYSLTGQIIYWCKINDSATINLNETSKLSKGCYLYSISVKSKTYSHKFIIQ